MYNTFQEIVTRIKMGALSGFQAHNKISSVQPLFLNLSKKRFNGNPHTSDFINFARLPIIG
jgi:hypothetical protein